MMHFDITVWCDFARGLIQGRRVTMLQSHLNICRECGDVTERLTRLWSLASEERKHPVPAHVVNAAKLIYDRADVDLYKAPVYPYTLHFLALRILCEYGEQLLESLGPPA